MGVSADALLTLAADFDYLPQIVQPLNRQRFAGAWTGSIGVGGNIVVIFALVTAKRL